MERLDEMSFEKTKIYFFKYGALINLIMFPEVQIY